MIIKKRLNITCISKMIDIFMFCYCIIFKEGIYIIMDIFLDSKIITDNKLSSDTIAVYTALRMIQNSNINEYYVNMKPKIPVKL